jgi:hypothetical protein
MSKGKESVVGQCKLCGETKVLVGSHIVPDFVFRWLKDISVTGHLRSTDVPNRRTERGLMRSWLCSDCDTKKFGDCLEDPFAKKVFHPFINGERVFPFTYESWLFRFCVSVLWRVLLIGIEDATRQNLKSNLPSLELISEMQDQADSWRKFLLDEESTWVGQNVYLLPFGCEGLHPTDVGSRMNAYTQFAIDMGTYLQAFEPMVFAKMGPFVTFIPIKPHFNIIWEKGGFSRIEPSGGIVSEGPYVLPVFFKDHMMLQADKKDAIRNKLSDTQKELIDKLLEENYECFINSPEYAANLLDGLENSDESTFDSFDER